MIKKLSICFLVVICFIFIGAFDNQAYANEIDLSKYEYRFTEKTLEYYCEEFNVWLATTFNKTICNLLNGKYEVVKQ